MSKKITPKNPSESKLPRSAHRWTPEEDRRLLDYCEENRIDMLQIGKPGGVNKGVFWGQIPGRLDIPVTPLAAEMRYRTLTSESEWARTRRSRGVAGAAPAESTGDLVVQAAAEAATAAVADEIGQLRKEMQDQLGHLASVMEQLLAVWTEKPKTSHRETRSRSGRQDLDEDANGRAA